MLVAEISLLALASLVYIAVLVVSALSARDGDFGFQNATGEISDNYFTQVYS